MPDITYTPTYPGGWHDLPDESTAIDAAALKHLDDSFAAVFAQANLALATAQAAQAGTPGKQDADGTFVLPAPTGTSADDPIIAAALSSNRRVVAQPGVYGFTSHLIVPDGVDLFGQGGGSTSRAGRTTFKALAAGAQIEIAGGGGLTGGFEIDGNSMATTPFFRNGGTGANARTIHNITTHHNAVSGTNANDLALFYGAQNDYYYQCGYGYADRDARVFDQGFGGVTFVRCEITGTIGRYWDRYDHQIAGGVAPWPFNIVHLGTNNLEGGSTTSVSHVKMIAGVDITYDKTWFYSANALTGPSIDVGTGCILNLVNPSFQSKPSGTPTAGTKAISVAGTGRVTIIGRAQYLNFDRPINIDGLAAHVFDNTPPEFYNCTAGQIFTGTSGATVFQWENDSAGLRTHVPFADTSPAQAVQVGYNAARSALLWMMLADGTLQWFSDSGFPSSDIQLSRRMAGVTGTKVNTVQALATGVWTTANRPATAAAFAGGMGVNLDNKQLEATDGSTWFAAPHPGLPTYITTPPKYHYDPESNWYNKKASNTRRARAGLGRGGVNGVGVYMVWSDSSGAGCNQAIVSPFTFDRRNAWPISMAKQWARSGVQIVGTGLIRTVDGPSASDSRWSSSGTVGNSSAYVTINANGSSVTCTLTAADFYSLSTYTDVEIWYRDDGTGTWTAAVNGAVSGTGFASVTNAGTGTWKKLIIPGVTMTSASATLVITRSSGSNLPIAGANFWDPSKPGVLVHNVSQSGATLSGTGFAAWADTSSTGLGGVYKDLCGHARSVSDAVFNGTTTVTSATANFTNADIGRPLAHAASVAPFPDGTRIVSVTNSTTAIMSNTATAGSGQVLVIGRDPDGVIIAGGGNDLPGVADTVVCTAYNTIKGLFTTSDVVYVAEHQKNDTLIPAATWEAFLVKLWAQAEADDVPLFDFRARLGNYSQALANGQMGDNAAHLVPGAYVDEGRAIANGLIT